MKYIVKIIVDSYKEIYKMKNLVDISGITKERKTIKFIYNDLIELFEYIYKHNIKYKKINILPFKEA